MSFGQGDAIGLLLDLDAGSLEVYLGRAWVGTLVKGGLKGPLRWAVDVGYGSAIHIRARSPPRISGGARAPGSASGRNPHHNGPASRSHAIVMI